MEAATPNDRVDTEYGSRGVSCPVISAAVKQLSPASRDAAAAFDLELIDNEAGAKDYSTLPVRNVIFLGRSRVGKSTVVKVLQHPYQSAGVQSLYAQTRDPFMYTARVSRGASSCTSDTSLPSDYLVRFVDTPGLFEYAPEPSDEQQNCTGSRRKNKTIRQLISTFTRRTVSEIHLVCLVVSFETGISSDDLHAVAELIEEFEGAEYQFCLLVTRCERKLPSRRKELERMIRAVRELRKAFGASEEVPPKIEEDVFPNIKFIGSICYDDIERGDVAAIKMSLGNVLTMRSDLLQYILDKCDRPCSVAKLLGVTRVVSYFERDAREKQMKKVLLEEYDKSSAKYMALVKKCENASKQRVAMQHALGALHDEIKTLRNSDTTPDTATQIHVRAKDLLAQLKEQRDAFAAQNARIAQLEDLRRRQYNLMAEFAAQHRELDCDVPEDDERKLRALTTPMSMPTNLALHTSLHEFDFSLLMPSASVVGPIPEWLPWWHSYMSAVGTNNL